MIDIQQQPLSEQLKRQVYEGFSRHAIALIGHDEKFPSLAFVAKEGQTFAGSVVVEPFWGALHIKYVYVEENYRNQGLGSRLTELALAFGRSEKCPFAFVETMSFQAVGFYQKMGFEVEFSRSGYAHGTSFHYLRKDLLAE